MSKLIPHETCNVNGDIKRRIYDEKSHLLFYSYFKNSRLVNYKQYYTEEEVKNYEIKDISELKKLSVFNKVCDGYREPFLKSENRIDDNDGYEKYYCTRWYPNGVLEYEN